MTALGSTHQSTRSVGHAAILELAGFALIPRPRSVEECKVSQDTQELIHIGRSLSTGV
jgi:hypothetical protein